MMAAAKSLLDLGDTTRSLYLFDTYEGMTEPGEYDAFTRLIYKDWPWLEGRGGDRNGFTQVVAITAPGPETLYANPEGYSYARYIGTAQTDNSF